MEVMEGKDQGMARIRVGDRVTVKIQATVVSPMNEGDARRLTARKAANLKTDKGVVMLGVPLKFITTTGRSRDEQATKEEATETKAGG